MTRQQLVNCSTATQTIFDAFWPLGMYPDDMDASNLAAALRAVADQVVPTEMDLPPIAPDLGHFRQHERRLTRQRLLAIADELEAQ
jgi:hypothetical protein